MLKNIVAIRQDGYTVDVTVFPFVVPNPEFDLEAAVKAAAEEFCKTEEGREVYSYNCESFNWGDFDMYVPNELCKKHGFEKAQSTICSDLAVDFDEQLVFGPDSEEFDDEDDEDDEEEEDD